MNPARSARVSAWTRVALRAFVGSVMILYGVVKLTRSQAPPPTPDMLGQPLWVLSRSDFLWAFLGTSALYQVFAGLVETIAGCLVLVRRTVTAGALLTIAALANIIVLDIGFDVISPLLAAVPLLVCSMILLLPDLRRVVDGVVLGRAIPARVEPSLFMSERGRRAARWSCIVFIILVLLGTVALARQPKALGDRRPKPALYGAYEVETFARNGLVVPPASDDSTRWQRVFLSYSRSGPYLRLQYVTRDTAVRYFLVQVDSAAGVLRLSNQRDDTAVVAWRFRNWDPVASRCADGCRQAVAYDSAESIRRRRSSCWLIPSR